MYSAWIASIRAGSLTHSSSRQRSTGTPRSKSNVPIAPSPQITRRSSSSSRVISFFAINVAYLYSVNCATLLKRCTRQLIGKEIPLAFYKRSMRSGTAGIGSVCQRFAIRLARRLVPEHKDNFLDVVVGCQELASGFDGHLSGFVDRISVSAAADRRKSDGFDSVFRCQPQRITIAISQRLGLAPVASAPNRTDGVNDKPRRQPIALCYFCFARPTAAKRPAFLEQFRAGGAMNRAVNAAAAEQRRISCVHDAVGSNFGNVSPNNLDFVLKVFLHARLPPKRKRISGSHALDEPAAVGLSHVAKAIVQPIRSALPEFQRVGFDAITAPMRRERHRFAGKPFRHFRHARIEHSTRIDHLALTRGPRGQLATQWTRVKVNKRFLPGNFFRAAANANLSIQFDPVKGQCGVGIGCKMFPFFAFVIGEKDKALVVEILQQHDSHRRPAVWGDRCQAHGIRVANTGLGCRGKPVAKLLDRIRVEIAPAKTFADMLVSRGLRIAWNLHGKKVAHASPMRNAKLTPRPIERLPASPGFS